MKTIYFPHLIFSFFFIVILLPYFGSIDVIAPQWLFLALLNFLVFIIYPINKLPASSFFFIISFFLLQVFLSLSYSNNINISLVDSSRILLFVFTIINFFSFFSKSRISFLFVSRILSIILLIEIVYSLIPFFSFFFFNDISNYSDFYKIYSPNSYLGFAGNKNITAASICL